MTFSARVVCDVALAGLCVAAALGAAATAQETKRPAPPAAATSRGDNPHGSLVEECSHCHRADSWKPAVVGKEFDHAKSGFPLTGAHAAAACRACHASLDFAKVEKKPDCVACHQDPHRGELGIACARCHATLSFLDPVRMRRAHAQTRFPLSGAHLALDCGDCHRPAAQGHLQYVNTPTQCVDCHLDDYQATTSPDHEAVGNSLNCLECHRTAYWRPARFPNHDAQFFPIFSGKHKGKWSTCGDCHVNQANYTQFECILCHAHDDPIDLQGKHSGIAGYAYNSAACYNCHPRGSKE